MDLAAKVLSDDPKSRKVKASSSLVLAPRHLARRDVKVGKERHRTVAGVVVRTARQCRVIRRLQVAL